jgi:hypothetical protein
MPLLKYLLLTGWGLLMAAAANVFRNIYEVVQYHRQLRPIAPGSSSGISSGPDEQRPQLNWTTAKWAFPAAWLPLILAAGIVVVPQRDGRLQSKPDRGNAPRHFLSGNSSHRAAARPYRPV